MPEAVKPNPAGEAKPEGLSKYFKRMRTVLRRGSVAKSGSGSASNMEQTESGEGKTAGQPATATPTTAPPAAKPTTTAPAPAAQPTVVSHWSTVQEERTRALFAKYGVGLDREGWKPTDTSVERVVKPIRMRVRRSCHRCETPFGAEKVCVNCQHTRCKSCPRHPARKAQEDPESAFRSILAQKGKGVVGRAPGQQRQHQHPHLPLKPPHYGRPNEYVLRIPSRTGGQDIVRKPVKQRVRRTCHRCDRLFESGSKECSGCEHIRCKKCPRDPSKPEKYPDGYPGDVDPPVEQPPRTWKKPRRRIRYICHKCTTLYRSGQKICANCGQERCAETIREPPKHVKPEPDPEIVRKVEERLASLKLAAE